jgi:hypothetical protein
MDPLHALAFTLVATRRAPRTPADPLDAPEWRPFLPLLEALLRLRARRARPGAAQPVPEPVASKAC